MHFERFGRRLSRQRRVSHVVGFRDKYICKRVLRMWCVAYTEIDVHSKSYATHSAPLCDSCIAFAAHASLLRVCLPRLLLNSTRARPSLSAMKSDRISKFRNVMATARGDNVHYA